MKLRFVLIGAAAVLLVGLAAVLLVAAVFVAVDDAPETRAGKVTIRVRHKMVYVKADTVAKTQCVAAKVGVCHQPAGWNKELHRAGGERCRTFAGAPQPFFSEPPVSDFAEYEFEVEPNQTRYWFVFLGTNEKCGYWRAREYEDFRAGKIELTPGEQKTITVDFTETDVNK